MRNFFRIAARLLIVLIISPIEMSLNTPLAKEAAVQRTMHALVGMIIALVSGTTLLAINIGATDMAAYTSMTWTLWTLSYLLLKLCGMLLGLAIGVSALLISWSWVRVAISSSPAEYWRIRKILLVATSVLAPCGIAIQLALSYMPGLVSVEVGTLIMALKWASSTMLLAATEILVVFGLLVIYEPERRVA